MGLNPNIIKAVFFGFCISDSIMEILDLYDDVLMYIFKFLPFVEIVRSVSHVCRRFQVRAKVFGLLFWVFEVGFLLQNDSIHANRRQSISLMTL